LDANQGFLDLVGRVTKDCPGPVELVCADANAYPYAGPYDAVIFFESFHHLIDHQQVVERIAKSLTLNGVLVLAAEPILGDHHPNLPYPWGPRLDGESVRAMRRWGWTELGFRESYLIPTLKRIGYVHRYVALPGNDWCRMHILNPIHSGFAKLRAEQLGAGWHPLHPDHEMAWTSALSATLMLTLDPANRAAGQLQLLLHFHSGTTVTLQSPGTEPLCVHVDTGCRRYVELAIPANSNRSSVIVKVTVDALRLSGNGDPRPLGIGVSSYRFVV
jgi:SAM-dependent methyltransferase